MMHRELTGKAHTYTTVILHPNNYYEWLLRDCSALARLRKPFPASEIDSRPLSKEPVTYRTINQNC